MKEGKRGLRLICTAFVLTILLCGNVFAASDTGLIYGENDTITRAEWLHDLVVLFDMTVMEDGHPEDYYADLSTDHKYYDDIMTAAEFGVVDVPAGKEVGPDKVLTRDFAAHTLNFCLGFQLEEDTKYTFSDTDIVECPDDAQVSVDHGWFSLVSGKFAPEKVVTTDEVKKMVEEVQQIQARTVIDENHDNKYEFAEDIVVVPEETSVSIDENKTVTIYDTSVQIPKGNRFAVFDQGLPLIFTAQNVTVGETEVVVQTTSADTTDALESVDAQGVIDIDLKEAKAADGGSIVYIEGGTAAANYQDGIKYYSLREVQTKHINEISLPKVINIGDVEVRFTVTISDQQLEYKLDSDSQQRYIVYSGHAAVDVTANADALKLLDAPKEVPIVEMPVAGIGTVGVYAVANLDGSITTNFGTEFRVGVEKEQGQYRLVRSFIKEKPTFEAQANLNMGIRASASFNAWALASGYIYVEMGVRGNLSIKTYKDEKLPRVCTNLRMWMYGTAGASLKILGQDVVPPTQKAIWDYSNSPVRKSDHWEDGVYKKNGCTRGTDWGGSDWYSPNFRYGGIGNGYGFDEGGNYVPIFTYTLKENEFGVEEATITGYTGSTYALAIPSEIDGHTVVGIADYAFDERSDLHVVNIPDTVIKIGKGTFRNDVNLTQVNLSKNLTYMGSHAFGECKNLTSIEIPKSLEEAGIESGWGGPFGGCSKLEIITFEEGTQKIAKGLFYNCDGLRKITIPDTVVRIESAAFEECENLESIDIPDSVTEIGDYAFESCVAMSDANIGDGVLKIGKWAFNDNVNLTQVNLSKNLTYMGSRAFGACKNLTSIEIPKSLEETDTGSGWGGPFAECSKLENVTFEEGTQKIAKGLFYGCDGLRKITMPDTVVRIESAAFEECENLESIDIPDSVTEIGDYAFINCNSLISADIPDKSAGNLGQYLFSGCSSLSSVKLPKTQDKITTNMFYGCADLTEISLPETIKRIERSAFENAGLMTVELPEAVTYVGESAYKGNEALEKVTVLDSPAEFGEKVFQGCVLLNDVSLGKQLKSLGRYAFYGCDALTSVEIPDSATSIGDYCFAESDKLSEVKLGTGITAIPSYAFNLCPVLKSIVLPYRVAKINANAFTNCIQLTEITIPRETTEIADNVFSYPARMTIYGVAGTYAETYAKAKGIKFEAINHPAETVSLDQTELRMLNGTSQKLVLSVEPMNFTDAVSWKSMDDTIVSVDAGGSGEIRAKAVGKTTIKVSVGRKSATCEVTVVQPVTSVSLNRSSLSLQALETFQLTASVYPNNAENKEIEWSSSDEDIASVDENGFVTARKKGKATITVKALDGSEKSAACEVTVTNTAHEAESVEALESSHPYETNCTDYWTYKDPNEPDSIKVAFDTRTSTEKGFDYICIYDGERKQVGRFTGDELSGKVITVPGDTVKIQLVTDESADDESVEWGFRVTSITSGSEKLPQEFTGTTAYSKTYGDPVFALDCVLTAGDGELAYESDNEAVASVDADGNVTINGAGTAQITVTAAATADYQRTQQTITIEVAKAKQEMKLDYSADTLYVGETLKLCVTSENGTPSFTSDQETVATVSADGVVTGVAPGAVKITALLAGDKNREEAKEIASLTVLAVPEGSVSLTKCKVALASSAFVFDGKEKTPKVIVSYNGTTLAEDTDYTLSYRNNVQPGTAYVIVKAVDGSEYYGVVEKEFTIKPKLPEDAKTIEPYAFSDCDDIYEANIGETVTEIGDGAFAGCDNLKDIYFSGNAPKMGEGVFEDVAATAYYPADDSTWTRDVLESYGGSITWKAWDPATGEVTKRSLSVCTASLEATEYVYDGEPKTPVVTVMDGKVLLEEDTDYTVNYSGNAEPGAATVTVQGAGEYGGTIVLNFTIRKLAPTLRFGAAAVSRTYGDAPFKNPLSGIETDGTISYTSGNVNVATVDGSGTVTIRGAGTVQITALASAGKSYEAGSASYTLTVAKAANTITVGDIAKTWSKKQQSFAIGATAAGGARLSYSSNNKSLPVSAAGIVTAPKKYIGSAVVTIQAAATANYNAAAKTITVSVNPKGTTVRKVKNNGSKRATVTWKKNTNVKGYQIQYSTDKSFASGAKAKNVSGNKKESLTLKKLKKGQTYYVRIRTWTKVKGKKYYSAWSKAKSVKIRK